MVNSFLPSFWQDLVTDVTSHEDALEKLEMAVNDVITLVDESDQSHLSSLLQSTALRYHCHGFHCRAYPVSRWLDDRSLQLCSMPSSAVLVPNLQVCFLNRDELCIQYSHTPCRINYKL